MDASKIPTNTKTTCKPYKKGVFDAYVIWRSIPACLRDKNSEIAQKALAENPIYTDLLDIKNQTDFAKRYGVENSTLTNWNKLLQKRGHLSEITKWGQELTKDLLLALYLRTIEDGNAESVRLWFQIVEGWNYKKNKAPVSEEPIIININTRTSA